MHKSHSWSISDADCCERWRAQRSAGACRTSVGDTPCSAARALRSASFSARSCCSSCSTAASVATDRTCTIARDIQRQEHCSTACVGTLAETSSSWATDRSSCSYRNGCGQVLLGRVRRTRCSGGLSLQHVLAALAKPGCDLKGAGAGKHAYRGGGSCAVNFMCSLGDCHLIRKSSQDCIWSATSVCRRPRQQSFVLDSIR